MKIKHFTLFAFVLINVLVSAQTEWTLKQCIDYAIDNNITVKKQMLNVTYSKNQLQQSKYSLIPSLKGSVGQSFNYGKSLTQLNTYTNNNSQNSELTVNSEIVVFNSFAKNNTIKGRSFMLQSALNDLKKAKDDITLSIVFAYLEILFNKELVTSATEQINITAQQIKHNEDKFNAGYLSKGKLLETKAQITQEQLVLINHKNNLKLSLLNLMQLLEIDVTDGFDIVIPSIVSPNINNSLLDADNIFKQAVNERPEILSREFKVKSAEKDVLISKAQLFPILSAGASYYTNYNNNFKYIDGSGNIPFDKQFENNRQSRVYLTLQIPVFNEFISKTRYKNSIISFEESKYNLQLEKDNLLKEIQQTHLNAISAMQKYYNSEQVVQSTMEAFRFIEEKFNLGLVTSLEYNDAKNKVANAQSSFIQAKYEYVFRMKVLDFYSGKPIVL